MKAPFGIAVAFQKTRLTSIHGFTQAILDGTIQDSNSFENTAMIILQETGRLQRMVDDLLDLARLHLGLASIKNESIDINKLLAQILKRMQPQSEIANVSLQFNRRKIPIG